MGQKGGAGSRPEPCVHAVHQTVVPRLPTCFSKQTDEWRTGKPISAGLINWGVFLFFAFAPYGVRPESASRTNPVPSVPDEGTESIAPKTDTQPQN